jgi:hypothetical protein
MYEMLKEDELDGLDDELVTILVTEDDTGAVDDVMIEVELLVALDEGAEDKEDNDDDIVELDELIPVVLVEFVPVVVLLPAIVIVSVSGSRSVDAADAV